MKLVIILCLAVASNFASACQWYGDKSSHKRFGIDIGFVGKLVEKGIERDELGNPIRQWARFEPTKLIHGEWGLSKKFYFGKELGFPILVVNRLYVIHSDTDGKYIVPCYDFYGFQSFDSIKTEKYRNFVKFIDDPTPENYRNVY